MLGAKSGVGVAGDEHTSVGGGPACGMRSSCACCCACGGRGMGGAVLVLAAEAAVVWAHVLLRLRLRLRCPLLLVDDLVVVLLAGLCVGCPLLVCSTRV